MKKIKKTKIIKALLASGLSLLFLGNAHAAFSGNAHADVMTTTFNVSANIINPCTISATDMLFGNVTLSVGATATSQITIDCPAPISAYLRLNGGTHYSDGDRHLMQTFGGSDYLVSYELYSDIGMTEPFLPDSSGPFGGVGFISEGGSWIVPVYGKIPVQAGKPGGTYTDIIQVTVDY